MPDLATNPEPVDGLSPQQRRWVAPLEGFLPGFVAATDWHWLPSGQLPSAVRGLLAHDIDMTSTLAGHYESGIDLEVCRRELDGDVLRRLVVLHCRSDGRPVEVGAITIHLSGFDAPARRAIEEGGEPLGGILNRFGLSHSSHPRAFFSCDAAAATSCLDILDAPPTDAPPTSRHSRVYGRCNELRHGDQRLLADIVEILPADPS